MPLASLYFPDFFILDRWFRWGFVHCTIVVYLCTHGLQFIQCYCVHAVKRAKLWLPIQIFAKVCSVLRRIIHSSSSLRALPTLAGVRPARISMPLSTLCTCCTTEPASEYFFVMAWHWEFSDTSFYVLSFWNPRTGRSAILGYTQVHRLLVPFLVCFSNCAANTHGRTAKFAVTAFAKREMAVNTLLKVTSVKTSLSNIRFVPVSKSNQDLV
jgi:hypothetical protein